MKKKAVHEEFLRSRENGFDLSGIHTEKLGEYNALMDTNLRHHFESKSVQTHLSKLGLIDPQGRIVDFAKQKSKLNIIEQEFQKAQHLQAQRQRDEEEIRRRVYLKRHEAIEEAKKKDKLQRLKEEKKIAKEIIHAAKGFASVSSPTSSSSNRSTSRTALKNAR